jgi:hypothetical protein
VQDWARMCATRAAVHGHLYVDGCIGTTQDRSRYGGHLYSDKAPGMSMLSIPAAEAVQLRAPATWSHIGDLRLWFVRVAVGGVALLAAAFVAGRLAEGLAPGKGPLVLVALALGTLMAPFAATGFDHVLAAAFGFGAFALAWSRRPFAAGLAAGAALCVEYQSAVLLLAIGVYAALLGARSLGRYAAGAVPGVLLLGAYDWAAFGAPWHNALSYSDNEYSDDYKAGLLGFHLPSGHATEQVLVGNGGLLVLSPLVAAATAGLWLLWREGRRAEAALCAGISAVYLFGELGYFAPYGGLSPGPRYFIPALPFLLVGLGPALARLPRLTTLLVAASVVATTAITLTWAYGLTTHYRQSVWGEIARLPAEGRGSPLVRDLAKNAVSHLGIGLTRLDAAALVCVCAAAAFALALPARSWALNRGSAAAAARRARSPRA